MTDSPWARHLVSIHDQADYDRLATLTAGYTGPVLIGLYSDSAGNWQWKDGRPANMEFIMAHSYEPSQGDYGVGISNDKTRSVDIITRTAHYASLTVGGAGYDIGGLTRAGAPPPPWPARRMWCAAYAAPRVISDCHFAVPLNHFMPGFRSNSVAVFLK
jgi:hypothetical protein